MITKQKIIWQPHSGPQTEALTRAENEILYGGARGGGKTDAGIAWVLRWIQIPEYRFLVIRRNSGDLRDWIDRAKMMWASTGAEFTQNEVRFPSGAKGVFGHLFDNDAYERYQGHEYQKMVIEELTHIPTEELYLKLLASNRSTVDGLTAQVFCTTNPGNTGHKWVKKRFIEMIKPGERYTDKFGRTRVFIQAKVTDNPTLMDKDPQYIQMLQALPEGLRMAWLEGSWDQFEVKGAYYQKWIQEAKRENRITQVPYESGLDVHTWWDLGIGDSTAIGFFQTVGREWRLIDSYENSGEGLPFYREILDQKGYRYGKHFAPHDIEVRELGSGKSRLEMARALGIRFEIVPRLSVDDGIQAVRSRFSTLWIDESNNQEFIEAITQYRKEFDEKKNCFKNKPLHDWTSHYCLSGDTLIETDKGERAIKNIKIGDAVKTPVGFFKVLASGPVKKTKQLLELTFDNGKTICCTPEHRFFTQRGLVCADALRYNDDVWTNKLDLTKSNIKGLFTNFREDIMSLHQVRGKNIVIFIGRFGANMIMRSLRALKYIIKMLIPLIMILAILRLEKLVNIVRSIWSPDGGSQNIERNLKKALNWLEKRQENGMQVRKELNGIKDMLRMLGRIGSLHLKDVWFVMKNTNHIFRLGQNTATRIVNKKPLDKEELVYDLTIKDHHCYFANGILTSNSDMLRYWGVTKFNEGGFVQTVHKY